MTSDSAPAAHATTALGPPGPRRSWLQWLRVVLCGIGSLVVVVAMFWALRRAEWGEPTVTSSHAAPGGAVHADVLQRKRGISFLASDCRQHVMLNDAPGLAAGRQDFAYWDSAVLAVPCSHRLTLAWSGDRQLQITLEVPREATWQRLNWRASDARRPVDISFVVANLP